MKSLKNKLVFSIFLLLFVWLTSQCTSERILKKYYLFDEQIDSSWTKSVNLPYLPYSVIVEPFWINPAYKTKQMALRTRSHELQYYFYHQWAEAPDLGLRFLLWRKLKSLNLFQNCELALGTVYPQYGIGAVLDVIEVLEKNIDSQMPQAHIKARLELFDFKTRQVLVEHSFDRKKPLPEKFRMNQFVDTINAIVNRELDLFIKKIITRLQ